MEQKILLGALVQDRLTKFKGIVTARTEWLFGCVRYAVEPQHVGENSKIIEEQWFDEDRLKVIPGENLTHLHRGASTETTGGPRRDPSRR